jgi:hypothetical protein
VHRVKMNGAFPCLIMTALCRFIENCADVFFVVESRSTPES